MSCEHHTRQDLPRIHRGVCPWKNYGKQSIHMQVHICQVKWVHCDPLEPGPVLSQPTGPAFVSAKMLWWLSAVFPLAGFFLSDTSAVKTVFFYNCSQRYSEVVFTVFTFFYGETGNKKEKYQFTSARWSKSKQN